MYHIKIAERNFLGMFHQLRLKLKIRLKGAKNLGERRGSRPQDNLVLV